MEEIRKPFQGVYNIIRFNWHFYLIAFAALAVSLIIAALLPSPFRLTVYILAVLLVLSTLMSLAVSYYIYDGSDFYKMDWLSLIGSDKPRQLVNIHAGFDETSALIHQRFTNSDLIVLDFYDPAKHTEVSIRRARAAYPPYPETKSISTARIPAADLSSDLVFLIFAAHEIRNKEERVNFFRELHRILRHDGKILLVEHLRDLPNFIAFNIGFLHFYSAGVWREVIEQADLSVTKVKSINPFVKIFLITKK
jgi:SAM-dependent methyltransferase